MENKSKIMHLEDGFRYKSNPEFGFLVEFKAHLISEIQTLTRNLFC